jgi:predicted enzyme related to lactoylglutathione lyase
MSNGVVKWQILSNDPDRAGRFYSSVFGWKIDNGNSLGYREINTGSDSGIDGGIWPAPPEARDFVQLFIEVGDIDATIDKATRLGARVLVPKSSLPDGDTIAILLDPAGMSFGLISSLAD